jgi:hypothetical protein
MHNLSNYWNKEINQGAEANGGYLVGNFDLLAYIEGS